MKSFVVSDSYALYLWLAYGVVLAVLVGNIIVSRCRRKTVLKKVQEQHDASR